MECYTKVLHIPLDGDLLAENGTYVADNNTERMHWSLKYDAIYLEDRNLTIESEVFDGQTWTIEFRWNTRGEIWSEKNFTAKIATLPVGQIVIEYITGDCPTCGTIIPTYIIEGNANYTKISLPAIQYPN